MGSCTAPLEAPTQYFYHHGQCNSLSTCTARAIQVWAMSDTAQTGWFPWSDDDVRPPRFFTQKHTSSMLQREPLPGGSVARHWGDKPGQISPAILVLWLQVVGWRECSWYCWLLLWPLLLLYPKLQINPLSAPCSFYHLLGPRRQQRPEQIYQISSDGPLCDGKGNRFKLRCPRSCWSGSASNWKPWAGRGGSFKVLTVLLHKKDLHSGLTLELILTATMSEWVYAWESSILKADCMMKLIVLFIHREECTRCGCHV